MIIDECLLVLVHSQAEAIPARASTRAKKTVTMAKKKGHAVPEEQPVVAAPGEGQQMAAHSIEELAMIAIIDDMPVMQATRRNRAPATMAARPRLTKSKAPAKTVVKAKEPRKRVEPARPRSRRAEIPRLPRTQVTPIVLIQNLATPDIKMKERAIELTEREIHSEPVTAINTAIRLVMQASLDLGRPYDTNMLASTFNVTRSLVMQSLRKYYEGFVEQSLFTEEHFVPTYLWLYGVSEASAVDRVKNAIRLSRAAEPGSRSAFSIARDFVILFVSEVVHCQVGSLSSVATLMASIKIPEDVPTVFLEMTNSFLYRARMTGRNILKSNPDLGDSIACIY